MLTSSKRMGASIQFKNPKDDQGSKPQAKTCTTYFRWYLPRCSRFGRQSY